MGWGLSHNPELLNSPLVLRRGGGKLAIGKAHIVFSMSLSSDQALSLKSRVLILKQQVSRY